MFNMLSQPPFLSSVTEKLRNPDDTLSLLKNIEAARNALTNSSSSSLRVFIAGNLDRLSKSELFDPWVDFAPSFSM